MCFDIVLYHIFGYIFNLEALILLLSLLCLGTPGAMLILHYHVDIIILPFMLVLHTLATICWFL